MRKFASIAVTILLCSGTGVEAQSQSAIDHAKESIVSGQYADALIAAQEAQRADPTSFVAAYYVAMAQLGLKQYSAARVEADKALQLAPATSRATVEKLIATIASSNSGSSAVTEADAAAADGLWLKAAQLYERGWEAGHTNSGLALKAASIRRNHMNDLVKWAILLRQVVKYQPNSSDALMATQQLEESQKAIDQFTSSVAISYFPASNVLMTRSGIVDELRKSEDVYNANPNGRFSVGYFEQWYAVYLSSIIDVKSLNLIIKDLARRDRLSLLLILKMYNINLIIKDSEFGEIIRGSLGEKVYSDLSDMFKDKNSETLFKSASLSQNMFPMEYYSNVYSDKAGNAVCYRYHYNGSWWGRGSLIFQETMLVFQDSGGRPYEKSVAKGCSVDITKMMQAYEAKYSNYIKLVSDNIWALSQ